MRRLFTNNANSTLASGITSGATSLALVSGGGALFSNPNVGLEQSFSATIVKNGNPSIYEIILVTQRTTDTFSQIQRGQQSTTALAWNAGDFVYDYPTAGDMQQFAQPDDVQAQAGNFAIDTGVANAYVVSLTPALLSHQLGMPIRFRAAHGATGPCTFNDGAGVASLVYPTGGAINSATPINSNGIYTVIWDGSFFRLQLPDLSPFLTSALAAATYAPLVSPGFFGIPTAPTAAPGTATTQLATTDFVQNAITGTVVIIGGQYSYVTADGLQIVKGGVIANGGSGPTGITFSQPFPTQLLSLISQCANVQATIDQTAVSRFGFTSTNGAAGSSTYWQAVGN